MLKPEPITILRFGSDCSICLVVAFRPLAMAISHGLAGMGGAAAGAVAVGGYVSGPRSGGL